ncbi:MAG: hypothetical protein CFH08_01922, partial [Alphaproteobacteria bacterium MarineAlpha3_Bin7]
MKKNRKKNLPHIGFVGTGAVVGVPGHDKRDFAFAKAKDI